ncbi:LuxR C-terminal-related transcriptional regulator [Microbacterium pumilum]|uniref:LuxR C-terminal-related transcriptional regulator n=1 Tax=Microbacterium pumilum TaxID=344165 RepID=A0ABP5DGC1_9MICO
MARDDEPAFDLLESKLARPPVRPGMVERRSLLERLAQPDGAAVVSIVAPAGYGKTTLLSQWADRDPRPFAWISVDENDNDPKILLSYVASALDRIEPISPSAFDALRSPASSVAGTVVPRLGAALAGIGQPVVIVVDDVHLVHDTQARAALSVLAEHVPAGSQLVFAGRSDPPVRVARLRVEGRLLEIGRRDLELTVEQAGALLAGAHAKVRDEDIVALHRSTEGWPVGLYLAALYIREGGDSDTMPTRFSGSDRLVGEYVESEFLERMSQGRRTFLTRASALDRMSASLCEAVLDVPGAAGSFEVLSKSHLLLVPLDREGHWYRFHHLFRDMLRAELTRHEPDMLPAIRRRAAAWCLEHDRPEEAMEYSILADDVDTAARLLQTLWSPVHRRGQIATLQRWFDWLDERHGIDRYPLNAMNAAFLAMTTGRAPAAERWMAAVDRWESSVSGSLDAYTAGMAATLHALACRDGVDRMRQDADEAARLLAKVDFQGAITPLLRGAACVLLGELDDAEALFADAASLSPKNQSIDVLAMVRCQQAIVAIARKDWAAAEAFTHQAQAALREAGVEHSYAAAFTQALWARMRQHRGEIAAARDALAMALRLRPILTYVLPDRAVQCRLLIARVQLALDDLAGARTVMREVDEILKRRPQLGVLVSEADELRRHLDAQRDVAPEGATSLTSAELRVLPLLATHLTYSEIASELFVSKNTVKSQAYSVFRKLGANSRGEAVMRSRELALLEA